ncbi:MAG: MazG family protein, partial [Alphaproteobacteria bacterium]|nr:MazG family protein [Alphaproteobacteria bacterium]
MDDQTKYSGNIEGLLDIMARLRDPDGGCPWDVEQTFATIVPHTIEEAYEVADAIDSNDMASLKDELGDLLFQVVFYAQMAKEAGDFDFHDVVTGVSEKMVRRHPHVFADAVFDNQEQQLEAWEAIKRQERVDKGLNPDAEKDESALE